MKCLSLCDSSLSDIVLCCGSFGSMCDNSLSGYCAVIYVFF